MTDDQTPPEELESTERDELLNTLLNTSPVNEPRKNELKKAVKEALKFIYRKVNDGVGMEVMSPNTDENQSDDEDIEELAEKQLGFSPDGLPPYIQHALGAATRAIEHSSNQSQDDDVTEDIPAQIDEEAGPEETTTD